jgi:quercetin dioxygenase-like cupin family protein
MSSEYTLVESVPSSVETPASGILSKVLFSDDAMRVTAFAFAAGEEMTDHTSTMEATLHFLEGEAEVTLGDDTVSVQAGGWVQMNAGLVHGIRAVTAVKMLLVLLRATRE